MKKLIAFVVFVGLVGALGWKVYDKASRASESQSGKKEAVLKGAQVRRSYTRILVTWEDADGAGRDRVIGERFVDEGTMLRANDAIASVLDIDTLTAVVHVIDRDYSKIKLGQEAVVTTDAFPDQTFTGNVIRVAPLLKETARQARVEVTIPNDKRLLKPGLFVRLQIELDRHENATVVPLAARTRRNRQEGVFVADLKTMKARFVPLKLGIRSEGTVEVLSPPLSGMVVSIGQHLLGEDTTITVPNGVPASPTDTDAPQAPTSTGVGEPR